MKRNGNMEETSQFIPPGLYNIKQITDLIPSDTPWVEFTFDEKTDTITLFNKKVRNKIKFPPELANLLGLPTGFLDQISYKGRINLQPFKIIYIHCDQISTSENSYNAWYAMYRVKRFTDTR